MAVVLPLDAGNVFVALPSPNPNSDVLVGVYDSDTFTRISEFVSPPPVAIFTMPSGSKHFVLTTGTTGSIIHFAEGFRPVARFNLGRVTAAVMTGDGTRIVSLINNFVNILDTVPDIPATFTFDVGRAPIDVAASIDSTKAFVLSSVSNRLTVVDLTSNLVVGEIPIPGDSAAVTTAPNGYIYVSAFNQVIEIDPDSMAITNSIPVDALPGKLSFTPDGKYALAVNSAIDARSSLMLFDLANRRLAGVSDFDSPIARIVAINNFKAYFVSSEARTLYDVTIPDLRINTTTSNRVAGFANVTGAAASSEAPPHYLFVRGEMAGASLRDSIHRLDLSTIPITAVTVPATQTVERIFYTTAAAPVRVASMLAFLAPPVISAGGSATLTFRLLDATNRPVYGASVAFTLSGEATLRAQSATSNIDGFAQVAVTAGTVMFSVTATSGDLSKTVDVPVFSSQEIVAQN